ncbi:hypothetical protein [Halorussus caseinilyticus]|uniref:hypothetical protein n=1 Tax=Halorussus caseinilyticus TaxID=3034025 RepID=UPI0023E7A68F|nr:hypothetical protein [Halorussus sp. DT72]
MIDRLEAGDEVEFAITNDKTPTQICGVVRERADKYVRIVVKSPENHPNVTLVGDDEFSPALTIRRDYTWELLGTTSHLNVTCGEFKTVIHAK